MCTAHAMQTCTSEESSCVGVLMAEFSRAIGLVECPVCLLLGHLGAICPGSPQLKHMILVAACAVDVDGGRRA
jgi:hypothetical protein